MSTSTRLFLLLSLGVGIVMTIASFVVLRERERSVQQAMQREVRAHALTLRIALEESFAAGHERHAQQLITRLRDNTRLYSVVLFDADGRATNVSNTRSEFAEIRQPPELAVVLAALEPAEFSRRIGDEDVFAVIMPLMIDNRLRGALEVAESLDFVAADVARTRLNFVWTTLLILITILLIVFVTLRRKLSKPVQELLGGARAVGKGELDYRVIVPRGGGEFEQLAQEFNRMADHLAVQHRATLHEAEERLRLERELRHSERLAAVGRLAAGVAHELGAPLNVIDARAERLLEKLDATPEVRQRNLEIIRKQAARIAHIVRQLLNLARSYNLRRVPIDLNHFITETLESFDASAAQAHVELRFMPCENAAARIAADADFLRQVFANVIVNALQAMPDGGRLRVGCMSDVVKDDKRFASIEVSDTGAGLAAEHITHIFEPFYTTKDIGQGTGLGLAVTRRIVEEHGGWIEAANNADGGATFTIYLPQMESNVSPIIRPAKRERHNEREIAHR